VDLLDRLLGHDEWTTRQVLERAREVDSAGLHRPFDIGHGSFYETVTHMIGNVRTWTDLMNGTATKANRPSRDGLTVDDLIERHDEAMRDFSALARRTRDQGRSDDLWTDTFDDPPTEKTFGGAIGHVLTHDMFHRGELLHILARLGVPNLLEGDLLSWEARTEDASQPKAPS
jgi:uncharacterized damage-inducible protein DinB